MVDVQQTYRRLEPMHVVLALVWGLGLLIPVLIQVFEGAGMVAASLLALDAAGLACVYLVAPAASIAVTSRHVIVRNPFSRYVVPRRLIEGLDDKSLLTPRLLVRNAPSIRLAALNPNLGISFPNAGRHRWQGVTAMLDRIPEEPSDGQVDRRIRYGHVVLAIVAMGVTLAVFRYLPSIEQP